MTFDPLDYVKYIYNNPMKFLLLCGICFNYQLLFQLVFFYYLIIISYLKYQKIVKDSSHTFQEPDLTYLTFQDTKVLSLLRYYHKIPNINKY